MIVVDCSPDHSCIRCDDECIADIYLYEGGYDVIEKESGQDVLYSSIARSIREMLCQN